MDTAIEKTTEEEFLTAVFEKKYKKVKRLLEKNNTLIYAKNKFDETALHLIARCRGENVRNITQLLLSHNADKTAKSEKGATPKDVAVAWHNNKIIDLFNQN